LGNCRQEGLVVGVTENHTRLLSVCFEGFLFNRNTADCNCY
jgi:hypothetical protein